MLLYQTINEGQLFFLLNLTVRLVNGNCLVSYLQARYNLCFFTNLDAFRAEFPNHKMFLTVIFFYRQCRSRQAEEGGLKKLDVYLSAISVFFFPHGSCDRC